MTEEHRVHIIELPKGAKYKKICNKLFRNSYLFTYKEDNRLCINISKLMDILIDRLEPKKNLHYARNIVYTRMDIINGIIEVLENCTYWSRFKKVIKGKLRKNFGEYLRQHHKRYEKIGIYACLYKIILDVYFRKCKYEKLKDQSIDSTFIRNLYGKEMIQRNAYYKSKNGIKLSALDDKNGVATSLAISKGAVNDALIGLAQVDHNFITYEPKKVQFNNRYKPTILGDSHYYHKEFKNKMKRKGYNIYTDVNIRNTKDKNKLEKIERDRKEYNKVKRKRAIKEISFAWIHKYPKLDRFVEKTVSSYAGLLLLGYSLVVSRKVT